MSIIVKEIEDIKNQVTETIGNAVDMNYTDESALIFLAILFLLVIFRNPIFNLIIGLLKSTFIVGFLYLSFILLK